MKALVVDDSAVMRKVLIGALTRAGITEVDQAADGGEAVKATGSQEYGLVLMDWNMPNKLGIDAVKEIRSSGQQMPICIEIGNKLIAFAPGYYLGQIRSEGGFSTGYRYDMAAGCFYPVQVNENILEEGIRAPVIFKHTITAGEITLTRHIDNGPQRPALQKIAQPAFCESRDDLGRLVQCK